MAIGDIYELVHDQRLFGQQVLNRYHYENINVSGDADGLATAFFLDVMPFIQAFQVEAVTYQRLIVINLDDDTDFTEFDLTGNGGQKVAAQPMPSFVAASLTLLRSSRSVRNGFKRYAGLDEGEVNQNSLTAAAITDLEAIAQALENPIDNTFNEEWVLRIYGGVTPNRPTPVVVPISSVSVSAVVTSQTSRKPGVGR